MMAIVMCEYLPSKEILERDRRIYSLAYNVEAGLYADVKAMDDEEKEHLVRQELSLDLPVHIASIRQMSVDEHVSYLERITGDKIKPNSFLLAVHRD